MSATTQPSHPLGPHERLPIRFHPSLRKQRRTGQEICQFLPHLLKYHRALFSIHLQKVQLKNPWELCLLSSTQPSACCAGCIGWNKPTPAPLITFRHFSKCFAFCSVSLPRTRISTGTLPPFNGSRCFANSDEGGQHKVTVRLE